MSALVPRLRSHSAILAATAAGLLVPVLCAVPAQARVFFGFGFPLFPGPPVYAPPPLYYPPPVYYPPPAYYPPQVYAPPATYAPPPNYAAVPGAPAGGQSCYVSNYVCPMERSVAPGTACYCTVNGTRLYGRAN